MNLRKAIIERTSIMRHCKLAGASESLLKERTKENGREPKH